MFKYWSPIAAIHVVPILVGAQADERLRKLRDNDPDASVRAAATLALERWERVFKK